MRRILPKVFIPQKGFTLIEILVVIALISILAVIGFAIFSGVTARGNDARRSADIKAFADAMEVKKANNSYVAISATDFSSGVFPSEPTTRAEKYCYQDGTSAIANPAPWTGSACPASWSDVSGVGPTVSAGASYFKFCTVNEAKTAVICQGSSQ